MVADWISQTPILPSRCNNILRFLLSLWYICCDYGTFCRTAHETFVTDISSPPSEPQNPTISISDEMRNSYLDYAMSVIVSRALPDVRDGLKPVHRRILYAMMEGNYDWSKPPRKSARIVGDVMGNYHPHGDSSIYEAMVRMAQDFSMRLPLVDGQGNYGSVDGDPPAAMRYTESRLARAAESLLRDIDKDTVDFTANYDETQLEPTVLPAEYPNLLVNGANGIAVGMATNIPPHNPGEVIAACEAYIQNPGITIEELNQIVPGPDFPRSTDHGPGRDQGRLHRWTWFSHHACQSGGCNRQP